MAAGVVAVTAATVLLAVLAVVAMGGSAVLDRIGHQLIRGAPAGGWTAIARGVSAAAASPVLYPVIALVCGLLSDRVGWLRWSDVLIGPLVLGLGASARTGLSVVVGRARPAPDEWLSSATGFAFPSGHTANVTVVVGVMALLISSTSARVILSIPGAPLLRRTATHARHRTSLR